METQLPADTTSAPAAAASGKAFEKLRQYLMENPLKFASSAILMWGMGLLLTFFLRIRYMPEVNLESVSSVLYAVAVLGLVISAYTMLALIAPGLALANVKETFGRYAKPHLTCICIGAAAVLILQLVQAFGFISLSEGWNWTASGLIVLCAAGVASVWSQRMPPASGPSSEPAPGTHRWSPKVNHKAGFVASVAVTIYISGVLIFSLLFVAIIGMGGDIRTASNGWAVSQLVMLLILITACAFAIALSKAADRIKIAFVVAPTLLFMILVVTGSFSSIPAMAMKALGQGEISIARIAVTGSTCREINQTLGQRVCAEADKDDIVAVCPVMIKSRVGSQVVLEFAPIRADAKDAQSIHWTTTKNKTDNNPGQALTRRVILDKAKMLSWQPLQTISEQNIDDNSSARQAVATSFDFGTVIDAAVAAKPAAAKSPLAELCGAYFAPVPPEEKKGKEAEQK